jgi:hypothetical protein
MRFIPAAPARPQHAGHLRYVLASVLVLASTGGLLASAACSRPTPAAGTSAGHEGEAPLLTPAVHTAQNRDTSEVRQLTGARTRVVWVQHDGTDPFSMGTNLIVMAYDSDDGVGERVLLSQRGNYVKPLLTSDGQRVVVSVVREEDDGEVFVVDFDGTGLRSLGPGFGLHIRPEPGGGDWLYVGTAHREFHYGTVSRLRLDAPDAREVVWDKARVARDTFQVSQDGRFAGGLYPWPEAGVADLQAGTVQRVGDGCWTALCPIGPPLFWYFDGAHRNLTIVDMETDRRWMVPINTAPGFSNPEVYHPRWTNHPRFLAISGPYDQGGDNQVRSGGGQVEIHLGRFSADFTRVEAWARVTTNTAGDAFPDVWIAPAESPHPMRASRIGPAGDGREGEGPAPAGSVEPGRVVVEARLTHAGPIPSPESILPYRNALVVNRYEVLTVKEGAYDKTDVLVSQWIIRDSQVLPDARRPAGLQTLLTLERHDAHPELEGERLISDTDAPELPLYYDVGS